MGLRGKRCVDNWLLNCHNDKSLHQALGAFDVYQKLLAQSLYYCENGDVRAHEYCLQAMLKSAYLGNLAFPSLLRALALGLVGQIDYHPNL